MIYYGTAVFIQNIKEAAEDEILKALECDVLLPREFELRLDFCPYVVTTEVAGHKVTIRDLRDLAGIPTVH